MRVEASRGLFLSFIVLAALIVGVLLALGVVKQPWVAGKASAKSVPTASKEQNAPPPETPTSYETTVHRPAHLGLVRTHVNNPQGGDSGVQCSSCHNAQRQQKATLPADSVTELSEFHTELTMAHGELTCSSCHHPDDRDALRLANGTSLPFAETMSLCAQCHGPTFRSWKHGAHGGMRGHWDLSRGPRERNHCVACHDPHAPSYPQVMPAPPPRDRFFNIK